MLCHVPPASWPASWRSQLPPPPPQGPHLAAHKVGHMRSSGAPLTSGRTSSIIISLAFIGELENHFRTRGSRRELTAHLSCQLDSRTPGNIKNTNKYCSYRVKIIIWVLRQVISWFHYFHERAWGVSTLHTRRIFSNNTKCLGKNNMTATAYQQLQDTIIIIYV